MMNRVIAVILAALSCCGCYDGNFTPPQHVADRHEVNITIADLHSMLAGRSCIEIGEPLVIGGRVTSSDRSHNFYRTFTIADISGGAEILAGPADLFNIYPEGCYVEIHLQGCAADEQYGVLRIGLPSEEYAGTVDYFQSQETLDRIIIRSDTTVEVESSRMLCDELTTEMCGMLVTVEGLTPVIEPEDEPVWKGYRGFTDGCGGCICTYTDGYADFASEAVPAGMVSLTGILQYGSVPSATDKQFILKMRSREDCRTDN